MKMKLLLIAIIAILPMAIFSQCPGTAMQPLPFGGVEAKDSVYNPSDSVCQFEYPCDSGQFYGWFSYVDTFYNGAEIIISSSRSDSASILVIADCNTILYAECRDIDFAQSLFIDHVGGIVSVHVAIPSPAKITVRVEHAQQPTQPPQMQFPYSCNPTGLDSPALPDPGGMRVYYFIDTHKLIIR